MSQIGDEAIGSDRVGVNGGGAQQKRETFVVQVYATLFVMLVSTIVMAWYFYRQAGGGQGSEQNRQNAVRPDQDVQGRNAQDAQGQSQNSQQAQNRETLKRYNISDVHLRKISISAMDLLIQKKIQVTESSQVDQSASSQMPASENEYMFNTEMLEFLRAVRNKYRIYVLTNLAYAVKENEETEVIQKEKQKMHEMLLKLCKQDIIKGSHRLMYSQSEVGHIAQIRHLAADLHIENDFQIVKSLMQHMNKFHLIGGQREGYRQDATNSQEEMDQFVRRHAGKVLYFKDPASYSAKIKDAMSKNTQAQR